MKKVLIVDDSLFARMTMKKILCAKGYDVVGEAENGLMGVERYKELNPDVVTLDITMEEMDGIEALKAIKEYHPQARVFMVSAMGQRPFVEAAIAAGANGFFVKPFDAEVVASTLDGAVMA